MTSPKALAGRYELTAHIARGGMADVYEAFDQMLGRKVAVKVLHSQFAGTDTFVARFRKEAQAAANLSHPNIVSIYDWGEENGTYFIVMELVTGRTLRDILKSEGVLLPRRAVEVAAEVASALEVAHRNRVIHRDNKPGNILLSADGTVKVTDFGVARAWDDSQELTKTGSVIGTATYFSPEQARGEQADQRSDLYSLGVVLYEMLTGQPPFSGETPVSVAFQHVNATPYAPSTLNPDVPTELDRIVNKAMQKDPSHRYQTAQQMRADLLLFLRGEDSSVRAYPSGGDAPAETKPAGGGSAPIATYPDLPPPTAAPDEVYRRVQPPARRRNNLTAIISSVVVGIVVVIGAFLLFNNLSNDTPPGTTLATVQTLQVPNVVGMTEDRARQELQDAGLRTTPIPEPSEAVTEGLVIRTEPRTGRAIGENGVVSIFVSSGANLIPVPNVIGSTQQRAITQLRGQGFDVQIETNYDDRVGLGLVIGQSPSGTESARPGTPVILTVSVGPLPVEVPSVFGLTEEAAVNLLSAQGFEVDIRRETSEEVEDGLVSSQNPSAGTAASPGQSILLVISQGSAAIPLPDLSLLPTTEAVSQLGTLGLTVEVVQEHHSEVGAGLVIRTEPGAEEEIAEDERVVVVESIGPDLVSVPELSGLTIQEAAELLDPLGLQIVEGALVETADSVFHNLVLAQNPAVGEEVERGSTVTVSVGNFPFTPNGLTE